MPKGKNSYPDRWEQYSTLGRQIKGTNFIAFKVPLKESFFRGAQGGVERFTPRDLMVMQPRIKLVVDLTNTSRYYDKNQFVSKGVYYRKIFCQGRMVPPPEYVQEFNSIVDDFLASDGRPADALIGVHCTHGLNRTSYFICSYMIQCMGFEPQAAIKAFQRARGHDIEREYLTKDLIDNCRPGVRPIISTAPNVKKEPAQQSHRKEHVTDSSWRSDGAVDNVSGGNGFYECRMGDMKLLEQHGDLIRQFSDTAGLGNSNRQWNNADNRGNTGGLQKGRGQVTGTRESRGGGSKRWDGRGGNQGGFDGRNANRDGVSGGNGGKDWKPGKGGDYGETGGQFGNNRSRDGKYNMIGGRGQGKGGNYKGRGGGAGEGSHSEGKGGNRGGFRGRGNNFQGRGRGSYFGGSSGDPSYSQVPYTYPLGSNDVQESSQFSTPLGRGRGRGRGSDRGSDRGSTAPRRSRGTSRGSTRYFMVKEEMGHPPSSSLGSSSLNPKQLGKWPDSGRSNSISRSNPVRDSQGCRNGLLRGSGRERERHNPSTGSRSIPLQ